MDFIKREVYDAILALGWFTMVDGLGDVLFR